jgi:hypothetical protein
VGAAHHMLTCSVTAVATAFLRFVLVLRMMCAAEAQWMSLSTQQLPCLAIWNCHNTKHTGSCLCCAG